MYTEHLIELHEFISLFKICAFVENIGVSNGIFVCSNEDSDIFGDEVIFFVSCKDVCYTINTSDLYLKLLKLAVFEPNTLKRYLIWNMKSLKIIYLNFLIIFTIQVYIILLHF